MHNRQPAGRRKRNIISIILTFSPVVCLFFSRHNFILVVFLFILIQRFLFELLQKGCYILYYLCQGPADSVHGKKQSLVLCPESAGLVFQYRCLAL